MLDIILCLLLLLWLVAEALSDEKPRSERPLLPQHHDGVRYTAPLHNGEQRSVSEHQRQSAPSSRALYVHQEQERISPPQHRDGVTNTVPQQLERQSTPIARALYVHQEQERISLPQHRDGVTNTISQQRQSAPPTRALHVHQEHERVSPPRHRDGVTNAVPDQRRDVPPQRAQYVHQEHERIFSTDPLRAIQLGARGSSHECSGSEPPPLPQPRDNVRCTATLHDVEQRSVSEHQLQSAPPPRAQNIQHERVSSPEPLQAVQLSTPAVPQGQDQTPPQTSPQRVNEPVQNSVSTPPATVSPTEPKLEAAQTYQATEAALASDAGGEVSQHPQDDTDEGSSDYVRLRERAKQERETVRKYREEKQQARASGQSTLFEELDQKIKYHSQRHQLLDERASRLIFEKNNKHRSPDEVDLHGLTVMEATNYAKTAIHKACERGITKMRLIVGKGLHSSGPPVLKPCMLKLMQKLKLPAEVLPSNEGVLVVQLVPTSTASPLATVHQSFLQPSLLNTSQPEPSPILVPHIDTSPAEPYQWAHDVSPEPVWYGQESSRLLQNSAHHDAEYGIGDGFMLREYARQERQMKLNFRGEKKLAKAGGHLVLVRELAEKENEHRNRCDMFNAQASELIFAQNNKHGSLDWVVLHDLKAKEAKVHTKRVIEEARAKGIIKICLVVGEQSPSGALKRAMLQFLRKKRELSVEDDPLYENVLVVQLVSMSTESPSAVWEQTLLQASLSQTSQPAPSPIVVPHIDAPPDRLIGDSSRGLAQNCEVTLTPLVPVGGEELSELPQNAAHHDAEDGYGDGFMLREYAKQERQMKATYRQEKKLAKAGGQTTLAKELAKKEKQHRKHCQMRNAQASELIFAQNNKNGSLDKVVLQDLKAKEAKPHARRVIQEAREKGYTEVRLVVGEQGSSGALKPAMLNFLRKKCGLSAEVDATNEGILVVKLNP